MSTARTVWIGGPVLRAAPEGPFGLREAVHVGPRRLLGEVIRVDLEEVVIQVYEDTSGLRLGTEVRGSGAPLSVSLGPSLLGKVFDGLLRPLRDPEHPYVEPGTLPPAPETFVFTPEAAPGARLRGGQRFGRVRARTEDSTSSAQTASSRLQAVLVPPHLKGEVEWMAEAGEWAEDAVLCRLRADSGEIHSLSMGHTWPVRVPRPVARRLPLDEPLVTGQRILDALFPVARGSTAAIPGGFGTGKTVLLESLAKWAGADVIVYVGCGERGNEMAGMVEEFAALEDPRSGRLLKERTVMIANTSNMPVAAREASIYSGITVAEYFRDQGLHVALMADSTSRWAEALREVSGRLGEIPGEGGYPAYLSSRLAQFYERAARVKGLGGELGSVTVIGAVSPPSGDFSEPVVSHTRRYVRNFWALDPHRAQARFFPAINPLQSYSMDAEAMTQWWREHDCVRWQQLRGRFLGLLEEQVRLQRMARIIGVEALPPRQRFTLLGAALIDEGFLRQSAFSPRDRFAEPAKQADMMRLVGGFLELAEQAVAAGLAPEDLSGLEVHRQLLRMGEDIANRQPERFRALEQALQEVADGLPLPAELGLSAPGSSMDRNSAHRVDST
jgi:V/A-type H+-transporting ATPase subunit A